MYATTLTQKGQVTIPAPLRRRLKLKRGSKISFVEKKAGVVIEVIPDLLSLKGSLKTTKKYDEQKVNDAVGRYLAKRYQIKREREDGQAN